MKVYLKKETNWKTIAKHICCNKMKIALKDKNLLLDYSDNHGKIGFVNIDKQWVIPTALCSIYFCPWCGRKIEFGEIIRATNVEIGEIK